MIHRSHLVVGIVLVAAACASAPASDPPRAAASDVPSEVYIAVLSAAADRMAPRAGTPLYVESERFPEHVPLDRIRATGFELRSVCEPGGRNLSLGHPISPEEGVWVVDAVYSSRRDGTGHTEQYVVRCDGDGCRAVGGHGVQALVAVPVQASCRTGEPADRHPPPLAAVVPCGGIVGEVRSADDPDLVLNGALVRLVDTAAGAINDRYGRFSLTAGRLPDARFTGELRAQRFGYQPVVVPVSVHPDSATIVRIGLPKSMPRPEWQREPEVEVEMLSCARP